MTAPTNQGAAHRVSQQIKCLGAESSPLCWKSGCLRVPWKPCCGGGTRGGGAAGGGDVCFVVVGLKGGLVGGLWLRAGLEGAGILSDHASLCLAGVSDHAAMETADPDL